MNEDEYNDDDYIDEDFFYEDLEELRYQEIEFRVEQCIKILREVVGNAQISCSYQRNDGFESTSIYQQGFGDELARKGMCEHFVARCKEGWGLD